MTDNKDEQFLQLIMSLVGSLEDRSLSPEEAIKLIGMVINLLSKLRPNVKLWWHRVAIDGVISILKDTRDELMTTHNQKDNHR